jgi:hypothetical protein
MTDNKWARFAKIAFPLAAGGSKNNETVEAKAHRDWMQMLVQADAIVEAERKQTAERIIRAGKKRRNEQ